MSATPRNKKPKAPQEYPDADKRRDSALLRALGMSPQPKIAKKKATKK